tara:strand:+ start:741 stop:1199 length:459 start_codon:yes stop_codon:yes gene_type:complete
MKCPFSPKMVVGFVSAIIMLYLAMRVVLFYTTNKESFVSENPKDLQEYINNNDVCIVKFYADWCGHCKAMKEDWDRFYKKNDKEKVNGKTVHIIEIADTDKDLNKLFAEKYNFKVDGFPTIIKISKNDSGEVKIIPYSGERNLVAFEQFIYS